MTFGITFLSFAAHALGVVLEQSTEVLHGGVALVGVSTPVTSVAGTFRGVLGMTEDRSASFSLSSSSSCVCVRSDAGRERN